MTRSTAVSNAPNDPRIDPLIGAFLAEVNTDDSPFWTLPGPRIRTVLIGLQSRVPADVSGVTIAEKTVSESGQSTRLHIKRSEKVVGTPPVLLFIHGEVWIAGDLEN